MGTRELKHLYVTILEEKKAREETATLKHSNMRIRNARALGVSRPSQLHPHDLAIWKTRIQSQMNHLSRRCMEIKITQTHLMRDLCKKDQIHVATAKNLEAIIFLKQNSDWNGSAKVPYKPEARREQLEPELVRNGIPVIIYYGPGS